MEGTRVLAGRIWSGDRFSDGFVKIADGIIEDVQYGKYGGFPDFKGCIIPGMIDTHTHVADAGLKLDRRYGLEELVAPPNGLKHRYLKETPQEKIASDICSYVGRLGRNGISRIVDFREGGIKGSMMLRSISPGAVIMGRPVSKEFDPTEIDELLRYADGIGISSITDMKPAYVDALADAVHKKNKLLALHVSERVREDIDRVISLRPDLIVHMVQATHSDLAKCADNAIPISVCPRSNLYFGLRPPVNDMVNTGVDVSIGTDNAMLTPDADIFAEARAFNDLLSTLNQERGAVLKSLIACGRKILNQNSALEAMTGRRADILAIPCQERELLNNGIAGSVRIGP